MRVELRSAGTNDAIGVIDLQPTQLRRLTEVTYGRTEYAVSRQETVMRKGQPVAVVWLVPR